LIKSNARENLIANDLIANIKGEIKIMAVKRKGPINVMNDPSEQDLIYIQTCCTEALRQAKEGGLKTFEEFIEKIESVSVTESDKRGYGTTRILEASNRQSQLIIWFKEKPREGYITGEKLEEKMSTGQKYTKNEIEKSLNSQQLETESNTTKSVQKLHIRQEKEQAEKLRKIVVEERGVVHKAQEFGEDLARGKGPLNGIQITGLAIGGVTSLISGIQALSKDGEAEKLLALSKKLDRIKNKSKELEVKKEKLVQEMGSDRASSELAKGEVNYQDGEENKAVEGQSDLKQNQGSNAKESENKLDENRASSSSANRDTDRDKTVTEAEQEEQTNQTNTAISSEKAEQPLSQENIEKIPSESSQNSNQTESNKDNGNNNQFRTTSDILEFLSKEVDSVNQRVATLVEQEKAESIEENLNEGMSFNQKIEYLNQILDGVENKLKVFESQLDQLATTEQRITGLSSKTEKAAERATDITNNKGQINQHKSKVEKVEENLDNLTEKNEANRTEEIAEKVGQVANNKTVKKENTNDLTPEFVRSLYRMAKHNQGNLEELTPNQAVPIMNCQLEAVQNIERYKGFEYNITGLLNDDYQFEITAEKEGETYFKAIVSLQKKDGNSVVIETDQLPEQFKKVCTKDLIKGLKQRESLPENQSKTPEKSQNREAELVN